MRMESERGRHLEAAEAVARLSDELAASARLVREQEASIARYRKMYDRASALARIGVWECDLATDALTWTDGVYDLFDLPRGSPLHRPDILAFYEPGSRRQMERLRAAAIRGGTGFKLDIRIRTALGADRWLRLTADVEREDGVPVRIFGTKQDISAEKAAQEKLSTLQTELIHLSRKSAMGAMAATLAHELNQPLAAIGNYAAGTRRALEAPERSRDVREGIEAIGRCAFRASSIIRSLREMTNGDDARHQPLDPGPLIREAASLALAGGGEDVVLNYDLADDAEVSVDPVQLQQVIINLVRNALDAVEGAPRREIIVATALLGDQVEIRVDDTGCGIAPALAATLFESFVTSKPEGMGVGLSISRTIVEAHGGRIAAANRAGGGASVRVTLPRFIPPS